MSRQAPGWPGDTPVQRISILLDRLDKALASSTASSEALAILHEARQVSDGLDPYLDECSDPPPAVVKEMMDATDATDWEKLHKEGKTSFPLIPTMCAGSYEASVLEMLVKMQGGGRILEVGMFVGTTTLALALLPEVSQVVSLEYEPYLLEFASPFFEKQGVRHKIDVRIGDAKEALQKLADEGQQFDMAFIDADKPGYPAYFKSILDLGLLAPRGCILIDNSLYKGSPYAPHPTFDDGAKYIIECNDLARSDPRADVIMLPIRDGITIARLK